MRERATSVATMSQSQEHRGFLEVASTFRPALERLARSYERDEAARADLMQEILVALFRALPTFAQRSSLRTFVFRVAHNVAASHCVRGARHRPWVSLQDLELELASDPRSEPEATVDRKQRLEHLNELIAKLKPVDRQLTLLFLEGLTPEEIAEVTGLSSTNVTTKLSRLRAVLRQHLGGLR